MEEFDESGSDNGKKKVIIGIAAAVVVILLIVGAVVILRRRAAPIDGAVPPAPAGTNEAVPPDPEPEKIPWVPPVPAEDELPFVAAPPDQSTAVEPNVDRPLSDEEKKANGFPESWTVHYRTSAMPADGTNPTWEYVVVSKPSDTDDDGLSDEEEEKYGTDPQKADTDGDGLWDGAEVNNAGTDPLRADTDGDRVNDSQEIEQKRDPLVAGS